MADTKDSREKKREYWRAYYAANRDEAKASQQKWRTANPEKAKASTLKWRAANPEKVADQRERRRVKLAANPKEYSAKKRAYRIANREMTCAQKFAWNAANREKALEIQRKASKKWHAANLMKHAYYAHKARAGRRGIPFLFTFEEWATIWIDSGKWEERGMGGDRYCMARYGDIGPYTAGNVRICTNRENAADRRGSTTARKGVPWTPEMRQAIMAGRNKARHGTSTF